MLETVAIVSAFGFEFVIVLYAHALQRARAAERDRDNWRRLYVDATNRAPDPVPTRANKWE